jgi:hypothetical protein
MHYVPYGIDGQMEDTPMGTIKNPLKRYVASELGPKDSTVIK